ncbi:hypothetical protein KKJ04_14800 [Xenorhabdus bovienii]|uniref:hypothetical protein n=1 Tax=Xenorhabdus bovienii TaxID=40576 RepID=UPI0023B27043|nr:hypothetical protein [Xenorhabdus bovienii]MDE9446837.1 hypothetical protein [Xenorhabdus bovienii]
MSSKDTSSVTFTFNGRTPANWISALAYPSNRIYWINPDSPGSVALRAIMSDVPVAPEDFPTGVEVLREIMSSPPVDTDGISHRGSITVKLPKQADALSALLGLYVVADAKILLMAGCQKVGSLASVTVSTSTLLPSGVVISSEHKAERAMYFMTQNGICVLADSTIELSPEKLPGATFYSSKNEMECAGIERWGENGGEGWRIHATVMINRRVLLNGFGNMIELGDEPEVTINSISN